MRSINSWIVFASRRWWLIAIVFVANLASFRALFALEDRFTELTGRPVFDTQNDLTPEALLRELPLYEGRASAAYLGFAAFDFVFPLVAALSLAVLWAFLLRVTRWSLAVRLLGLNLPVFALLVTLFDYLENICLLTVIYAGLDQTAVMDAAIVCKKLKLGGLAAANAVTALLAGLAASSWIYRGWQKRQAPQGPTALSGSPPQY